MMDDDIDTNPILKLTVPGMAVYRVWMVDHSPSIVFYQNGSAKSAFERLNESETVTLQKIYPNTNRPEEISFREVLDIIGRNFMLRPSSLVVRVDSVEELFERCVRE